jgi:hypothetical protein
MCWALDKIDPLQQLEAHFAAAGINVGALRLATSTITADAISLVLQAAVATANPSHRGAGRNEHCYRYSSRSFLLAQTTSEAGKHPEVGDLGVRHLRFKYEVFAE